MPITRYVAGRFAALVAIAIASGCTMPRPVASFSEVQRSGEEGGIRLVEVTSETIPEAPAGADSSFPAEFVGAPEAEFDRIGRGDRLSIRIWESGTPAVFTSTGGGTDLGEVTVDESGRIYLPYAGPVEAAGLTVPELRSAAISRLRTVVLHPQVDIRMVEHRSALVSVQGDAAKTGSFPIERGRTRLGQLLAEAAPNQETPGALEVVVRRNGQSGNVRLADVYADPRLDIALRPGDSIILRKMQDSVTVLGAAGVQGEVPITSRRFSLLDAIAASKGLNPDAANPRAVFLMRLPPDPNGLPTVYHFDMRRPEAVAFASRTIVQDEDAVLISSAPFAQLRLVLASVAQSLAAVRSVSTIPMP